jgi:hypothetical protein
MVPVLRVPVFLESKINCKVRYVCVYSTVHVVRVLVIPIPIVQVPPGICRSHTHTPPFRWIHFCIPFLHLYYAVNRTVRKDFESLGLLPLQPRPRPRVDP